MPTQLSVQPGAAERWKAWLAAVLWLALIAIESTDLFSSANTGSWLYAALTKILGAIDPSRFFVWHHYLRKSGHVIGYGMLSWLLFRAFRVTFGNPVTRWSIRWARLAWLSTAAVATLDEWHQMLYPSRTGVLSDVVLDSAAGLFVQILLWAFLRQRN